MRKKYLLIVPAVLLAGAGAAGGAWYWQRSHDYLGIGRAAMARGDLRTAQIALRSMVRDRPESAEAHFRLGAVQLQLGDPVAAEKELKLALAGGWNSHVVLPLLARAVLAQGRYTEVLKDFSLEGLGPEQAADLLVVRALAYLGLQEMQPAQDAAAEAARRAPQMIEAPLAAARIALARNDPALAGQQVDRALQINPGSAEALLLKGGLLRAGGAYDAAVAAFTAALAAAPDAANIRLERASTLIAMNQDGKAREDVAAVLKSDARNPLGTYFQAVLLVRGRDWKAADAALQKISPIIARLPRGEYFLALVKINLDQTEQATDAASHYVARAPQDIAGIKLLARIHARARRPQQMVEVLGRAAASGLVDVELLELLGSGYLLTGQAALAGQTLDRAAALAVNDSEALAQIAGIRLGGGDAGGAERDLTRSLELAPDRPETGERLVLAALAAGDVDQAAAELDKLRRLSGTDPATLGTLLGLVRLGQLDLDGAQAAFEGVLAADPAAGAARLNLARVLALQGRPADAGKLLLAQLDKEPANLPALSAIAAVLRTQQQPDRLPPLIEAARRAAPDNAGLTLALANLLAGTGDARRAYALLDAVPKPQAAAPAVLALRARLQDSLGLGPEARDTYRQLLAATPADSAVRRRLAGLLVQAGESGEARSVLRQGLEVMPGNPSLLQALVEVDLRTGGLDAALATAAVLARDPANLPAARGLKGGLYMAAQRHADAVTAYQAELKASPSAALALATAIALDSAGRPADAQRLLQDWLQHAPQDVDVLRTLSSLDLQNRRVAEAEKGLLAVLAVQPNDPFALNNLAWIYQTRNDPRARALARKAYLLAPGPQSADTLGWIVTRQGDAKTGLPLLIQAAQTLPADPSILYHLAVALNATGQRDKAAELLTRLVNAPAAFEDKPAARALLQELGGPKPPPPPPPPP